MVDRAHPTSAIEDDRGVDTAQIRALLRMSPTERVAHMVNVANTMRALADHAARAEDAARARG